MTSGLSGGHQASPGVTSSCKTRTGVCSSDVVSGVGVSKAATWYVRANCPYCQEQSPSKHDEERVGAACARARAP